ncbi:MAG: hypothetical protein WKF87_00390 [Chryseolinea sp.]
MLQSVAAIQTFIYLSLNPSSKRDTATVENEGTATFNGFFRQNVAFASPMFERAQR